MLNLLQLIFMILALTPHQAKAQPPPPYTSFFAPLHKHTDTLNPLYSVQIMTAYTNMQFTHSNFLIDIDAPLTWHDCIVQWNMYQGSASCSDNTLCTSPVSCDEYQCTDVRASYSYKNPYCPKVKNTTTFEGYCACSVNVMNPINGPCSQVLLNYDTFFVNTSNGRNPLPGFYAAFSNAACAPSSLFESFPENVTGVLAFSSSPYAFPVSLDQPPLKRIFSLCFPSTTSTPGILFYGNGPYYLFPQKVDVKNFLSYTSLLKHPDSFGYFIGVNSIVIKTRSIDIPGNVTTKLSTIEPYTTLRTDIYNRVVRRFSMVTKRLTPANPISPFGLCFSTFANGTKINLRVPDIELILQDGKKWAISTANSMLQITQDVACLAFVDGGATMEYPIVIGTFQFEDNFLLFDLENSNFGFSSSLLRKKTSCANFNFTMGSG